jgi:signal transduction histidine kinase
MDLVKILGKVIEVSHSNLEIPSRVNTILNVVAQEFDLQEAIVYTLDSDKRLTCRFSNRGSHLFDVLRQYRCHVGEGVVGTVAQKRAPQFFTLRDVPPRFGCLFYAALDGLAERYKFFAFLPLADDSFLYGVLLLCSSSREGLRDPEKILLSIISREIGGILRMYDLLVTSKKRIGELATLSELGKVLTSTDDPSVILESIAMITAKALNAQFATIQLDHAFVKIEPHRFTSGTIEPYIEAHVYDIEAEALRLRRSALVKDVGPSDANGSLRFSLHSTPIISKDRALGTLTLARGRQQNDFTSTEEDQYLLATIANYISSGLESALLNIKLRGVLKELGDAQRRVIEHEKLRSLGEMTANIAHEIKNPLVIIGGFTKRLAKKAHLDEQEARYIDIIINEVARLEAILNEILNYVRETPLLLEPCNVNSLLEEILYLLASTKSWDGVRIVKEFDPDLHDATCDVQQIKQVLINVLLNAFEAMRGHGTITVTTRRTAYRERPFVALSLADTGGGIEPALLDNIFNPFFTTKEKGSGLGLAISNKIVMHHNGHIEVKNAPGEGVTFTVYLPLDSTLTKEESP